MTNLFLKNSKNISILLIILYGVGLGGFFFQFSSYFVQLTPIQLLTSLFFVLAAHHSWKVKTVLFCIFCAVLGFLIEVVGVATGDIFGNYAYGSVLGLKFHNTPLIIGINWLLITYCSGVTVNELCGEKISWWKKSFLGAVLMVSLDILIEPTAMKTDMWHWANNIVPLKNYTSWFIVSLVMQILFQQLVGNTKNKIGYLVFILQFLFFGCLYFFH